MFTDGLVERRNRPFDTGIALAAAHLRKLPKRLEPNALIDSLLATLVADATVEDDIAVVIVERLDAREFLQTTGR